jgi:DNA-3-methyladenine glycosylase II
VTQTKRNRKPPGSLPSRIATADDLHQHIVALATVDRRFGPLYEVTGKVDVRWLEPGFKGLFKVITGQQISAAAGKAIFARCEAALGLQSADCLAGVDDSVLKAAGLSTPKIRALRAVADAVTGGALDLDRLDGIETETAIAQLVTVKGIGRWTAEVYLLFALGHPDIFPTGDLALREAACQGFRLEARPAEKELAALAANWRPLRSAAARLLWAYYAATKRGREGAPV